MYENAHIHTLLHVQTHMLCGAVSMGFVSNMLAAWLN